MAWRLSRELIAKTLEATKANTVFNFEDMCTEWSIYDVVDGAKRRGEAGRSGIQVGRCSGRWCTDLFSG